MQRLAVELRASASRMTDCVGGGLALVFAATDGARSLENAARLRAAAGFPEADSAREAATVLLASVRDVISSGTDQVLAPLPSLGERGAGGLFIVPMIFEDRLHGALVVGFPGEMQSDVQNALVAEASRLTWMLDHGYVQEQLEAMHQKLDKQGPQSDETDSQEILELSEALFAQDIELLRSNEKLGKIEKLKNDFIEKMSRELRTPLNSIIEAIISVLTGENETLSDSSKAILRSALDDGTEFLRTLQNILDLWRIKQRELPVEVQEVNFREVIDEAIFSIQDRISAKPLSVEQRIVEPFPKIRTDLTKINQILFLLLENAVKFTPRGQVTITAKLLGDQLQCEVRDTGIGICPDDQPHIFDEFFQVDEPSSRTYAGAGLGLALVRDLVVLMAGDISVSSDAGRGTAVTVQIPIQTIE
jgi:signal transduction histidine kinase